MAQNKTTQHHISAKDDSTGSKKEVQRQQKEQDRKIAQEYALLEQVSFFTKACIVLF